MIRIGHGYDVHRLAAERQLILGGVKIEHSLGLQGHSDADVVLHAICDGILGALGRGDIGHHFPDTSAEFNGINSRKLVRRVAVLMKDDGFKIGNLDVTVVAQLPKLAPYLPQMGKNIAADLECATQQINLKATTTEQLGFIGREEGIATHAVVLLEKDDYR